MVILSSILGGLTGVVGSVATAYSNYKIKKLDLEEKKLNNEFELSKIDKTAQYNLQNTKLQIDIEKTKYEGKQEEINSEAFLASVKTINTNNLISDKLISMLFNVEGPLKYLSIFIGIILITFIVLIELLQKLIRPGITIFYTISMFYIIYKYYIFLNISTLENILTPELLSIIIDTITYITSSSCLFWFGDRASSKYINKLMDKKK